MLLSNEVRTTLIAEVATNPTVIDARMTRTSLETQLMNRVARTIQPVLATSDLE